MTSRASHETNRDQARGESRSSTPANSTRGYASENEIKGGRESGTPFNLIDSRGALLPDPGQEADFEVEDNKFAFSPGQLGKLYSPNSLAAFVALGGLAGLEKGLRTDRNSGLSVDEGMLDGCVTFADATGAIAVSNPSPRSADDRITNLTSDRADRGHSSGSFFDRIRIFSDGQLPPRHSGSIFRHIFRRFENRIFTPLLLLVAIVHLSIRLTDHSAGQESYDLEWHQIAGLVSLWIIYLILGGLVEWQCDRNFTKLHVKAQDCEATVIRSGKAMLVSKFDVLVGDIVLFEPGDVIPADGILVAGHQATFDESGYTGEAGPVRKIHADEAMEKIEACELSARNDPFIISGSCVTGGVGSFLVTGVGIHSNMGRSTMSFRVHPDDSPVQVKLARIYASIIKLGLGAVLLVFVISFVRYLVQLGSKDVIVPSPMQKTRGFLLYSASFAISHTSRQLLRDNSLVLKRGSCDVVANTTTVCTSMTGVLTRNKMRVVAGVLGDSLMFDGRSGASADQDGEIIPTMSLGTSLHINVKRLLKDSIVLNSTAFDGEEDGRLTFIGSSTERALLTFAREQLAMDRCSYERASVDVINFMPFESNIGYSAVAINLNKSGVRVFVQGRTETLIRKSNHVLSGNMLQGISTSPMNDDTTELLQTVSGYCSTEGLRTIGLAYTDLTGIDAKSDGRTFLKDLQNLTYIGTFGIQDQLRHGVIEAVKSFQSGGVAVRMITRNDISTAKAIAEKSGILTPGGIIMNGRSFRLLETEQQQQIAAHLQVLANCTGEDKRFLVEVLRDLGEDVVVTGHHQDDAPSLKVASVGFSLGICGEMVARQASDITLMDDSFVSVLQCIRIARTSREGIDKIVKFWISSTATSFILAISTSTSSNFNAGVLMPGQLLWINLLINCLAGVALVTDRPSNNEKMHLEKNQFVRIHQERIEPEITNVDFGAAGESRSWNMDTLTGKSALLTMELKKEILERLFYQVTALMLFRYAGTSVLGPKTLPSLEHVNATTFNMFVWMQILSLFSNHPRYLRLGMFNVMTRNLWFSTVVLTACAGQSLLMFFGATPFNLTRIDAIQWAISVGMALFVSFGIAVVTGALRQLWRPFKDIDFSSVKNFSISGSITSNKGSGMRETAAAAFATIVSASIAGSVAGLPATTHRFQRKFSLKRISSFGLFAWIPIPLILEQMRLTFYTIYVNGFRIEALADTGASVNLVSKAYVRQDPAAWEIIPQSCRLRLGDGKTCRSSGYIRTTIRFDNSEELHPITLYIINGLPYDVTLSHDFLSTTSTVQFSRPGGITRESTYPVGPSQPANAVILTHLVAVRQRSILDKMRRCFGWERRSPSTTPEDANSSYFPDLML
ncbi:hypothetical protein IFR05_003943 [Cadophora sp. M221]|nr:hypothetical protein IFR05_003943 [Cadophora sp. M221]